MNGKAGNIALSLIVALALPGSLAGAQERVIHDTLSSDTPTALTCGFCAGERFGVVFRELPAPRRGIEPTDFPITLESVQVAVAAATVTAGPTCVPSETGGTVVATVELYAGEDPPEGNIQALPAEGPWSDTEALVWAGDADLALSTAEPGGTRYSINFNVLDVRDEEGAPIVVESGSYLRAVVSIPAATTMTSTECPTDMSPAFVGVRDADGNIASERGFIYATGAGWLWNEDSRVQVNGDWGIRLELFRTTNVPDGGAGDPDAGNDAGNDTGDAGSARDASMDGGTTPGGGGCSCRAIPGRGTRAGALFLVALAVLAARRTSVRRALNPRAR